MKHGEDQEGDQEQKKIHTNCTPSPHQKEGLQMLTGVSTLDDHLLA